MPTDKSGQLGFRIGMGVEAALNARANSYDIGGFQGAGAARQASTAAEASLSSRVSAIHGVLDPRAANSRTTAALRTTDGQTIIASGGRDLTPSQRSALLPNEAAAKSPGNHAEQTIFTHIDQTGQSPAQMETSRPICTDCQSKIEARGGTLTSPTTVKWPW